ncbi:SDR family oxidoreductase [Prosthecodimorpha staleyi]|uniref:SDR family oxidoreductase n=1 Tax=Prosthecodimorpha staleyi TaxID=2840188 RepID=A0A947D497_9HYPH|nr:SDR family oxidoreductase [Prosthecodimorpha staleyi]MBT9287872.1 SDR family oxidoreductase [Prosthecodimorpha staleyi]
MTEALSVDRPVAVVTGGGAGIGAAISRRLIDAGHHVVSLSRGEAEFADPHLETVAVDLSDPAATRAAATAVAARHAVGILVHNAGTIRARPVEAVTDADLDDLTHLHVGAPLILLQAFLPAMRKAGAGRVVLISSRAALGLPTRTAYSATKAGMIGMARTWALELGPAGITVNVVAPGPIQDTAMFRDVIEPGSAREQALAAAIPVKRLGRSDDVARAVTFFTAPEAGFVTGQVLYVCGGASVGTITI